MFSQSHDSTVKTNRAGQAHYTEYSQQLLSPKSDVGIDLDLSKVICLGVAVGMSCVLTV